MKRTADDKVKKHLCNIEGCGKSFERKDHLTNHLNAHSGVRPYSCTYPGCDKSFTQAGSRTKHMLVHSNGKFECSQCKATFRRKPHLDRHTAAVHDTVTPFRCKCGREFASDQGLQIHYRRKHTDDRPFVCSEDGCTATFACSSGRCRHIKTVHKGEKRFECDQAGCNVTCTSRHHLTLHKKLVEVIKNWEAGPDGSLQIQYMYYDCHNVDGKLQLDIWDDSDYSQDVVACCKDPIK